MRLYIATVSETVTQSTENDEIETCGSGKVKLISLQRKGEGADAKKFKVVKTETEISVVNPWPVDFDEGTRVLIGRDETGVPIVINQVCE